MNFTSTNPKYEQLRKKWTSRQKTAENLFWEKHGESLKNFALGSLGGLMLLAPIPHQPLPSPQMTVNRDDVLKSYDQNVLLAEQLRNQLPNQVRPLEVGEEEAIVKILSGN